MRYTFPKTERLTSKKLINRLFDRNARGPEAPQSVYAFPFRVMYLLDKPVDHDGSHTDVPAANQTASMDVPIPQPSPQLSPQVLFSVPKRAFKKAVDRNLIRRRCREAYRLNKRILQDSKAFDYPVAITFLYTAKAKISFDEIDKGMKLAMKRIKSEALKMKS